MCSASLKFHFSLCFPRGRKGSVHKSLLQQQGRQLQEQLLLLRDKRSLHQLCPSPSAKLCPAGSSSITMLSAVFLHDAHPGSRTTEGTGELQSSCEPCVLWSLTLRGLGSDPASSGVPSQPACFPPPPAAPAFPPRFTHHPGMFPHTERMGSSSPTSLLF